MANPHRGEVVFEVDGKPCTLRLNTNALCSLEHELDLSVDQISARMIQGYLSVLRSVLRVALVDRTMTHEEVGDMIDILGPQRTVEVLVQAFKLAFPSPEEAPSPPMGESPGIGTSC